MQGRTRFTTYFTEDQLTRLRKLAKAANLSVANLISLATDYMVAHPALFFPALHVENRDEESTPDEAGG